MMKEEKSKSLIGDKKEEKVAEEEEA